MPSSAYIQGHGYVRGKAIFSKDLGSAELWTTDGTAVGTQPILVDQVVLSADFFDTIGWLPLRGLLERYSRYFPLFNNSWWWCMDRANQFIERSVTLHRPACLADTLPQTVFFPPSAPSVVGMFSQSVSPALRKMTIGGLPTE